MRYIVYGAGAVGGTVGGRLHQAGHEVVLIARGTHYEAIAKDGLCLESPDTTVRLDIAVVAHPDDLEWRADDVVFLSMKGQDTDEALQQLKAVAPQSIAIACLQNGIDNERRALRWFAHVYAVCVMLPATHLDPGVVQAHSAPVTGLLDLGCYPSGVDDTAGALAAALSASTFDSHALPDVMRWKYRKLLSNLLNAAEALSGPAARGGDIARAVIGEGEAALRAAGIDFASRDEDTERRGSLLTMTATSSRPWAGGSTWQSLSRGTGAVEVDYLNGEIALIGRLSGTPTPLNTTLQHLANAAARAGRPPGALALEELLRLLGL